VSPAVATGEASSPRTAVRVGFLGFGEAAKTFAAGLRGRVRSIVAFANGPRSHPPYSDALRAEADRLGVRLVGTIAALAHDADLVFSAVATSAARAVAEETAPALGAGHTFIDVNAVPPDVKEAIAALMAARGVRFVDAELMGAASLYGAAVPLYASGDGAAAFRDLASALGLSVTVVPGAAGAAAVLKMLRSVVTKGMEAVIVEAMFAAFRAGVAEAAFAAVTEPMDAVRFSDFARMCLTTDPVHAARRAQEMQSVAEVVRRLGVEPIMTDAARRRLQWSARFGLRPAPGEPGFADYREVLRRYAELDTAARPADERP
jgi:3-hydroxyisobutyrate dehydrogenase-like beta-hydroxyacid dehydrogenase